MKDCFCNGDQSFVFAVKPERHCFKNTFTLWFAISDVVEVTNGLETDARG